MTAAHALSVKRLKVVYNFIDWVSWFKNIMNRTEYSYFICLTVSSCCNSFSTTQNLSFRTFVSEQVGSLVDAKITQMIKYVKLVKIFGSSRACRVGNNCRMMYVLLMTLYVFHMLSTLIFKL